MISEDKSKVVCYMIFSLLLFLPVFLSLALSGSLILPPSFPLLLGTHPVFYEEAVLLPEKSLTGAVEQH